MDSVNITNSSTEYRANTDPATTLSNHSLLTGLREIFIFSSDSFWSSPERGMVVSPVQN